MYSERMVFNAKKYLFIHIVITMLYYLFIEKKTREFLRLGQRDFPDLMKRPFLRCKRIHQII